MRCLLKWRMKVGDKFVIDMFACYRFHSFWFVSDREEPNYWPRYKHTISSSFLNLGKVISCVKKQSLGSRNKSNKIQHRQNQTLLTFNLLKMMSKMITYQVMVLFAQLSPNKYKRFFLTQFIKNLISLYALVPKYARNVLDLE